MGERGDSVASFAWVASAITAAVLIPVGLLLAPVIGRGLTPDSVDVFPGVVASGLYRPEPTEFVAYLFAIAGPILVAGATLAWRPRRPPPGLASAAQPAVAFIAVATFALLLLAWFSRSESDGIGNTHDYFSDLDGVLAILLAALVVAASGSTHIHSAISRVGSRKLAIFATAAAVVLTAVFLLPAIQTERSLLGTPPFVLSHLPYYLSDYAALGDGLTPLVDHANHYAHLLPFLVSPVLAPFDYSPAALTIVLTGISCLALVAAFRGLVIASGSQVAGLLLYGAVLGLIALPIGDGAEGLVFNGDIYSFLPARLAVPLVVFWLCARHLNSPRPRGGLVVMFVASLGAWHNPEFGLPCAAAAALALVFASWEPTRRGEAIRRVAIDSVVGMLAATAIVAAITLVRAGALPDPDLLLYFSRLATLDGFALLPMPTVGLWIAVYITFAGTLVLAAVRAGSANQDRALTGLLAYSSALGLGVGAFYVGRSDRFTMTAVLAVWALNLALLVIWAIRARAASLTEARRPPVALAAFGFAALIALCLGAVQLLTPPAPWTEVDRMLSQANGKFRPFDLETPTAFVARQTEPDEQVLILRESSDMIARDAGVRNVSPVSEPQHIIGPEQLDFVLDALAETDGTKIFVGDGPLLPLYDGLTEALQDRGWAVTERSAGARPLSEWQPSGISSPP